MLGRQPLEELDFEALEMAVRRVVLRWTARWIQDWLNADDSDRRPVAVLCPCGHPARYVDRRSKRIQSALGELELERAYYHCPHCGTGFCPRDGMLGIEGSLSPAVLRMIASVAAVVSFQEGSQLLEELAGVSVEAKQVERAAEALGAEIAAAEKQDLEPLSAGTLPHNTLYLGVDGTGVPMRPSELAGHAGKQPDGSAKTREVKLCTVWSAESRDPQNRPRRDEGSVTYTAAIESAATLDTDRVPSDFTQRVLREATRRRFTQAQRQVAIGDGAPWIWKLAQELFPRAIQIVDKFHAKEHLSQLGKLLYPDPAQARTWAQRRHEELDSGRFPDLLRAIRRHADHNDEARKCFQYLHRNRERMRYPQFEAQGLCTGSGVVEAACKGVIGTRLKRSGMRWTVRGANAIIALRCSKLSGRFQDFWERRSGRRAA